MYLPGRLSGGVLGRILLSRNRSNFHVVPFERRARFGARPAQSDVLSPDDDIKINELRHRPALTLQAISSGSP